MFKIEFGENPSRRSDFMKFLIFRKINVIALTLRHFLDLVKGLYTNESNADIQAAKVLS